MLLAGERKGWLIHAPMSATQQELDRLASLEAGWESVWHRLWEALDERLHGMLMHGSVGDPSWALKTQYSMLGDVHRAQDFICDLLVDFHRRAESGTLLAGFKGGPDQVLAFLTAGTFVRHRALDFTARQARVGITGMPGGGTPTPIVHPLDAEAASSIPEIASKGSCAGVDVMRYPIVISWETSRGIDARIRMAALQCWGRLAPDQEGLDLLEADLQEEVQAAEDLDPMTTLKRRLEGARIRIAKRLDSIDGKILATPRMHAPRRELLDAQRVALRAELLLMPLSRQDVQALLALPSPEAAYQQLSRYRRAFDVLFSSLKARLEEAVAQP